MRSGGMVYGVVGPYGYSYGYSGSIVIDDGLCYYSLYMTLPLDRVD